MCKMKAEKIGKIMLKVLWEMVILLVATIIVYMLEGNKLDVFNTYLLMRISLEVIKV